MASRIDIELTSRRDDGTWTWRAAGARQPKGVVDAALVSPKGSVGDQLRAEVEIGIDGMTVVAILPPKTAEEPTRQRIEIIGSGRPVEGVSVSLAGGRRGGSGDRYQGEHRGGDRPGGARRGADRPGGDRRGPGDRSRPGGGTPSGGRGGGSDHGEARGPERSRGPRPDRSDVTGRPPSNRPGQAGVPTTDGRRSRPGPAAGSRPARVESGTGQRLPADRRAPSGGRSESGDRGRRRLQPSTAYRNAALAELRPEELPVAEQLLRGGIPRVRQAIEEQNQRARAEGRDEVSAEPLLAMAETLLPKMNLAIWMDRAASARDAGRETPLRDLRSIVTSASTVTLDDAGRALAETLRQTLHDRVTALHEAWLARIGKALDEGRVLDALAAAGNSPEHGARLPAELAVRLAEQAGAAMTADIGTAAWTALLQAVIDSPVRRTVRPVALPSDADDQLRSMARRAAGLVPELARLLGLPIPPPPGPRRPAPAGRHS